MTDKTAGEFVDPLLAFISPWNISRPVVWQAQSLSCFVPYLAGELQWLHHRG